MASRGVGPPKVSECSSRTAEMNGTGACGSAQAIGFTDGNGKHTGAGASAHHHELHLAHPDAPLRTGEAGTEQPGHQKPASSQRTGGARSETRALAPLICNPHPLVLHQGYVSSNIVWCCMHTEKTRWDTSIGPNRATENPCCYRWKGRPRCLMFSLGTCPLLMSRI